MFKSVLKEIIIILLLTLAIILLLGVILYDYVPMNKVLPEKVTYTSSEEVKQISSEVTQKNDEIPITSYTVTSTDLKNYKRVNDYTAGRKNPFAAVESSGTSSGTTTGTTGGNTGAGTSSSEGSTTSGNTGNSASSGTTNTSTSNVGTTNSSTSNSGTTNTNSTNYYPDRGTK